MIEVIKKDYWSRSDAFLLPLVGLPKDFSFNLRSFLFWDRNSIEDYKLTISYSSYDQAGLMDHCQKKVFPILDEGGYLLENYDIDNQSVYVLDMSRWASDIEKFTQGKYSRFSNEAKALIEKFHTFKGSKISIHVYAVLYPHTPLEILGRKTAMDYVAENYGFNVDDLKEIGELGSIYDRRMETLEIEEEAPEI